jgi:hypothetical protein
MHVSAPCAAAMPAHSSTQQLSSSVFMAVVVIEWNRV